MLSGVVSDLRVLRYARIRAVVLSASEGMLRIWRRLFGALDRRERRRGAILLALMVVVALAEAGGVASVMPFVAVLSRPDAIESNRYLTLAYRVSGADSRNGFLLVLGVT